MQIDLRELELPVRLRTERPMTDDELMRFSSANQPLRIKQESNGDLRSMNDRLPDIQQKTRMWMKQGAELARLVDPERKAVEIYRPGNEPELVDGASAVCEEGPVSGFVLEPARLWA